VRAPSKGPWIGTHHQGGQGPRRWRQGPGQQGRGQGAPGGVRPPAGPPGSGPGPGWRRGGRAAGAGSPLQRRRHGQGLAQLQASPSVRGPDRLGRGEPQPPPGPGPGPDRPGQARDCPQFHRPGPQGSGPGPCSQRRPFDRGRGLAWGVRRAAVIAESGRAQPGPRGSSPGREQQHPLAQAAGGLLQLGAAGLVRPSIWDTSRACSRAPRPEAISTRSSLIRAVARGWGCRPTRAPRPLIRPMPRYRLICRSVPARLRVCQKRCRKRRAPSASRLRRASTQPGGGRRLGQQGQADFLAQPGGQFRGVIQASGGKSPSRKRFGGGGGPAPLPRAWPRPAQVGRRLIGRHQPMQTQGTVRGTNRAADGRLRGCCCRAMGLRASTSHHRRTPDPGATSDAANTAARKGRAFMRRTQEWPHLYPSGQSLASHGNSATCFQSDFLHGHPLRLRAAELQARLQQGKPLQLVDVREAQELELSRPGPARDPPAPEPFPGLARPIQPCWIASGPWWCSAMRACAAGSSPPG
jgi:hypothetical protein